MPGRSTPSIDQILRVTWAKAGAAMPMAPNAIPAIRPRCVSFIVVPPRCSPAALRPSRAAPLLAPRSALAGSGDVVATPTILEIVERADLPRHFEVAAIDRIMPALDVDRTAVA